MHHGLCSSVMLSCPPFAFFPLSVCHSDLFASFGVKRACRLTDVLKLIGRKHQSYTGGPAVTQVAMPLPCCNNHYYYV